VSCGSSQNRCLAAETAKAVSQLLWPDKDREVWFSLGENHEKVYRFPDFLHRSTGREQLCATFFAESRMQFGGSTNTYRKSGKRQAFSWFSPKENHTSQSLIRPP
jgi:hypothetical protein